MGLPSWSSYSTFLEYTGNVNKTSQWRLNQFYKRAVFEPAKEQNISLIVKKRYIVFHTELLWLKMEQIQFLSFFSPNFTMIWHFWLLLTLHINIHCLIKRLIHYNPSIPLALNTFFIVVDTKKNILCNF